MFYNHHNEYLLCSLFVASANDQCCSQWSLGKAANKGPEAGSQCFAFIRQSTHTPFLPLDLSGVLHIVGVLISSHTLPGDVSSMAAHSIFDLQWLQRVVRTTGLILLLLPCNFLTTCVGISRIYLPDLVGLTFGSEFTGILRLNQIINQSIHCSDDNLFILCRQQRESCLFL